MPKFKFFHKRKLEKSIKKASNYKEWLKFALEYDDLNKKSEQHLKLSGTIDENHLKNTITKLKSLQTPQTTEQLISELKEAVYNYYDELTFFENYTQNTSGFPPIIVSEYISSVKSALEYLCYEEISEYSVQTKLKLLQDYSRNLGKTALLLSGGGALGIYHLGVVKALFFENLLPEIIGGSSMGAIIGASICTRTKDELDDFFNNLELIDLKAFKFRNPKKILEEKALFDTSTLLHHIKTNIKEDLTFLEAYEKTGLILNISVSPVRTKQKPRILNYITTPDLLISYAATASCAMPGLYKPAILMSKNEKNNTIPYLPFERWIDGTLGEDLPMNRIRRLLNVNHYVVSQANPHIVPFIGLQNSYDLKSVGIDLAVSLASHQAQSVVKTLNKRLGNKNGGAVIKHINTLLSQTYLGDINIYPPFNPILYSKMLRNPDLTDLKYYIRLGEVSTWNKIKLIDDQTMLKRVFYRCIKHLERKINLENS